MSRLGSEAQVLVSAGGIYVCYLYYGILQERIYRPDSASGDKFSMTLFLLSTQCLANALLGWAAVLVEGSVSKVKTIQDIAQCSPLPFKHSGNTWLVLVSLSYLTAMGCSNQALQHVSYPLQALAKSCKMVPVMLGGVIIGGKRYKWYEYLAVLLITGGVLVFQMKGSSSGDHGSSLWGMFLLFASLLLDGITASNQDLFAHEFKPSGSYMMMSMNFWSLVFLLPLLWLTGEGISGWAYLMSHQQTLYDVLMFSLCSAIGQQFIFYCIVGPGPLVCTTITTTRKILTVVLSVLWFPENKITAQQWAGVGMVFAGLSIELVSKQLKKRSVSKDKAT